MQHTVTSKTNKPKRKVDFTYLTIIPPSTKQKQSNQNV